MRNILKSIQLDHFILKSYYKTFLFVFVIATLIAVFTKIPALTIGLVVFISAPYQGLYFSVYEKSNLSMLYGILPLRKNEFITGRYLYALAFGLANGIAAGILTAIISLLANIPISQVDFLALSSLAFVLFCLFIAIQFPLYLKIPFSKVYIYSNVPYYLLIPASIYIIRKTTLLAQLPQILQTFTANPNLIWLTGLGLGLLLLLVSYSVASVMNRPKQALKT